MTDKKTDRKKVSTEQAEEAVRVILEYIGEDLTREGIKDTPARVVKSYDELFAGYNVKVEELLDKKFCEVGPDNDIILLRSINFSSLCEHHMLPFWGRVDIAYLPEDCVIGISKIARIVDAYSKRLQIQERMTSEIAMALQANINPKGVAVKISAYHNCMISRGVLKTESLMDTVYFTGMFKARPELRQQFFTLLKG